MAIDVVLTSSAVLSIIAGILILVWPRAFRILAGLYLLLFGIIQLVGMNLPL